MKNILEVQALTKQFKRRARTPVLAVDNVSFSIEAGETFGLLGESGSGKTTVAQCVLGLVHADQGRVRVFGQDWTDLKGSARRQLRKQVQAIFQDPALSLNPLQTVGESLLEPLEIHRVGEVDWRSERVANLLSTVGLGDWALGRKPANLSGGERQRVALARALILEPQLLVADEAVSALDSSTKTRIIDLLLDLKQSRKLTTLFISHDLRLVGELCERAAVMLRGKIVEMGRTQEILGRPVHPYTKTLIRAAELDLERVEREPQPEATVSATLTQISPGHWALI